VALVIHWQQHDDRSDRVAPGKLTISDAVLAALIRHAHRRGLAVLLFPILHLEVLQMGHWRGTLQPRHRNRWWLSYERFILHYARIARRHKVAALLVGSELGTTELWRARWYHLVGRVRRVYSGKLVYRANWDHFDKVSFWRRIDYLGVTGYFELSRNANAGVAELSAAWRRARAALLAFAAKHKKPLWITEVGYPSVDGAATQPWNYARPGKVDVEEQRRCYAAFVTAWSNTPGLAGVFFWNWNGAGGKRDRSYTPRGKPAEAILRRWFR